MDQLFANSAVIFALGLAAIVTPGPDFFLMCRAATYRTRTGCALTAAGISVGVALHLAAALSGLAAAAASSPAMLDALRAGGASYLLFVGGRSLLAGATGRPLAAASAAPILSCPFSEGLFCNMSNVKAGVFFLGLLSRFITAETALLERVLYGAVLWVQAMVYWLFLSRLLGSASVGAWLQRRALLLERLFGCSMLLFGGVLLAEISLGAAAAAPVGTAGLASGTAD